MAIRVEIREDSDFQVGRDDIYFTCKKYFTLSHTLTCAVRNEEVLLGCKVINNIENSLHVKNNSSFFTAYKSLKEVA